MMDKIICIGKNYLAHAQELGDAVPEKPVIFLKPPSVLKQAVRWHEEVQLVFPYDKGSVHYECEIVLKINRDIYQATIAQAENYFSEVSLGLDLTLRDVQSTLKKQGHPWTIGKVFRDAAVVGPWISRAEVFTHDFQFLLNQQLRQQARVTDMLMSPAELIAYASQYFPLCKNDLLFTGTPVGVGAVNVGDKATLQWGNYYYGVSWS